jgi:hypothetical protein
VVVTAFRARGARDRGGACKRVRLGGASARTHLEGVRVRPGADARGDGGVAGMWAINIST